MGRVKKYLTNLISNHLPATWINIVGGGGVGGAWNRAVEPQVKLIFYDGNSLIFTDTVTVTGYVTLSIEGKGSEGQQENAFHTYLEEVC